MSQQMKFRKKPVVIEATQWFKHGDHDKVESYDDYSGLDHHRICEHCAIKMFAHGWVPTLEGGHIVCPGDWIITGVKGEHYPCKPDIFEQTYERVK